MPVIPYQEFVPDATKALFIAPDAWVIGKVELAPGVSIFFGSVLRGDLERIIVGAGSNIQEHTVIHTTGKLADTIIGKDVTIGHGVILHSCTILDRCIIGMGSTILDQAEVGPNCIVGANSLVTIKAKIPEGTLALGSPAKPVRDLTEKELSFLKLSAEHYQEVGAQYARYFATNPS